ncbi:MAG TPA: hypothetical protein VK536_05755 [Candidatus Limnocylindrales bacterium]|nr:hypothetical protein [Candidatus Limnocylindrales bacterium]
MKFKAEVCLLSLALSLFVISAFFYSYQTVSANLTANWSYPYQGYSIGLVAFGSVLTLAAFVSYSKRGKNIYVETFSSEDKPDQ